MYQEISAVEAMPSALKMAQLPFKTSSYQPVGHSQLLNFTQKMLQQEDMRVVGARFQTDSKGNKMIATLDVLPNNLEVGETIRSMTLRNSYDKSMSIGYMGHNTVIACLNN